MEYTPEQIKLFNEGLKKINAMGPKVRKCPNCKTSDDVTEHQKGIFSCGACEVVFSKKGIISRSDD